MGPYDTTINQQFLRQMTDAKGIILEQLALDPERSFFTEMSPLLVARPENERLPYWSHPFTLDMKSRNGDKTYVFVDGRQFRNKAGGVNRHSDMQFLQQRAVAEYHWQVQPAIYENQLPTLSVIFGEWVALSVFKNMGGTELDRVNIRIVATAYYICHVLIKIAQRFDQPLTVDELKSQTLRILSNRGGGLPTTVVLPVLDNPGITGLFTNVVERDSAPMANDLAVMIQHVLSYEAPTLTGTTLLRTLPAGSWMGVDAVLLCAMAIEYPPVFAAMINTLEDIQSLRNKVRIGAALNSSRRKVKPETVTAMFKSPLEAG